MTPYGYKIENGHAVLDPEKAPQVMAYFRYYLDGLPVTPACQAAGVERAPHSSWKILEDRRYMGDDFYPQLIDPETFNAVQEQRRLRNHNSPDQIHYQIVPGVVAKNFQMKHVSFLPQNPALIPQHLYNCIQICAGGEGLILDEQERERLLFHVGYALEMVPDVAITVEES